MNTSFASYVIVAWVVVIAVGVLPSFPFRRAMTLTLLSGSLFLPEAVPGVVELGPLKFAKLNSISYALLLGGLLYDAKRLLAFAPSWVDLPALAWCVCPAASVLLNDPPPDGSSALRDAASLVFAHISLYLVPYIVGRVYFSDSDGMREIAIATVVGGLVYVPFCLYEIRMSPQLHSMAYGYMQHDFNMHIRFGGYRPMVFMQSGLAVGMFMTSATIVAAWTASNHTGAGYWRSWRVWVFGVTLVACKSTGAVALAVFGLGLRALATTPVMRAALLILAAAPPAYCVSRMSGVWNGAELVQWSGSNIDYDRAESLEFRFNQENQLVAKALERPAFGWGGWGRNRVTDQADKDVSVTDGLWIIFMGVYGVVGLTAFGGMMLLPVILFARQVPSGMWTRPTHAPAVGCAVVVGLWCVDSLLNAMPNPLYLVMAGGLAQFVALPPRVRSDAV